MVTANYNIYHTCNRKTPWLNWYSKYEWRIYIYDKHDAFSFPIVNFHFISRNIALSLAYGVYISQLIRYPRACAKYSVFWQSSTKAKLCVGWSHCYQNVWGSSRSGWPLRNIHISIRVIIKLPNSEQSYKGKVKTHKYINRQNQSITGKLWKL